MKYVDISVLRSRTLLYRNALLVYHTQQSIPSHYNGIIESVKDAARRTLIKVTVMKAQSMMDQMNISIEWTRNAQRAHYERSEKVQHVHFSWTDILGLRHMKMHGIPYLLNGNFERHTTS